MSLRMHFEPRQHGIVKQRLGYGESYLHVVNWHKTFWLKEIHASSKAATDTSKTYRRYNKNKQRGNTQPKMNDLLSGPLKGNIDIMRTFNLVKLKLGRWKTIISGRLSLGLFISEKCVDIQCFAKSMSRLRQFFTTTFKQFIDDRQLCLWIYVHEQKYACSMLLSTENIWHLFLLTLIINW